MGRRTTLFVARGSQDQFIKREIPPTRMTVRLATGALITLMKRVVGLHYTLEGSQNDDDFICNGFG